MKQDDAGSAPMLGSVANPFEQIIRWTARLHQLIEHGQGESNDADSIRDVMDGPLMAFSDSEREAARMMSAAIQGRKWIPVTERLPPHYETVLYTCDLGPNEGFTDVESGRWEGARNDMGLPAMRPVWGDEDDWGPCSHWMPLPAPPETSK